MRKFLEQLHQELKIPREELQEMMRKLGPPLPTISPVEKASTVPRPRKLSTSDSESSSSEDSEDSEEEVTCCALIKSGERKGDPCGKAISKKSTSGKYCGRHLKLENSAEFLRKKEEEEIGGPVFRASKHGHFTFGETGLVLEPKKRIIIGRESTEGKMEDLDEDAITLCRKFRFKFVRDYSKKIRKEKPPSTLSFTSEMPL
jgi:hypothetical protein